MDSILHNFFAPPVPFFFIGLLAIIAHSDLEIPEQISKFISLYLLMAIGFKAEWSFMPAVSEQKLFLSSFPP